MDEYYNELKMIVADVWFRITGHDLFAPAAAAPEPPAPLNVGSVVTTAPEVASLQSVPGYQVASERLGPGTVQEIDAAGMVRVAWSHSKVETWSEESDLVPLAQNRRLVLVLRCDDAGHRTLLRHKIAALAHHWTIELRPSGVVRAERNDGLVWTFFAGKPGPGLIFPGWLAPPEDDDAEALTAAELACA